MWTLMTLAGFTGNTALNLRFPPKPFVKIVQN